MYEEEVQSGLNAMVMTLSNDATELIESIRARIAGMSEDERAVCMARMRTYFPVEREKGTDRTRITLELHMKMEAGYHLERYSFELRDGVWLLSKLETAGVDT